MTAVQIKKRLEVFLTEQDGVTPIGYALLAALIFVVIVASVSVVGDAVKALFEKVAGIFPLAG